MTKKEYSILLDEVFNFIPTENLNSALKLNRSAERVDAVQFLIRDAIVKSTIGKYKSAPYFFNGRIYIPMSYDEFGNLVYDLMKKCNLPNGDYARVEGVIKVCKRVVSIKELRPDRSVMVFDNCVLDTKTRTTNEFDAKYVQMTNVAYKYKKDDYPYQWQMFLDTVLPDKGEQMVLQESLGCLLINRNEAKLEHIIFLYGTGANGKSVVFETVMGIFGRENISNYPIMSLISSGDRKKNIASMDGMWANYSTESQISQLSKHEDAFKALISGEPTEARQIYGENFMAYNIPLQLVNVNKLPDITRLTNSLKRRIVIIDFKIEIPINKQNKQLSQLFRSEYSGIFNWIMDGRDRFIKNGYDFTGRMKLDEKTDEYQAATSTVIRYMMKMKYNHINKDIVDVIPTWTLFSDIYNDYKSWCLNNEITPETVRVAGETLKDAGYKWNRFGDGIKYAIYGTTILGVAPKKAKTEIASNIKNLEPYVYNGIKYINTLGGLSRVTAINKRTLGDWMKLGLMDDCYMKAAGKGTTLAFDIAKCLERIKHIGNIKKDIDRENEKAAKKIASEQMYKFNAKMAKHGSPVRKVTPKRSEQYISVLKKMEEERERGNRMPDNYKN